MLPDEIFESGRIYNISLFSLRTDTFYAPFDFRFTRRRLITEILRLYLMLHCLSLLSYRA